MPFDSYPYMFLWTSIPLTYIYTYIFIYMYIFIRHLYLFVSHTYIYISIFVSTSLHILSPSLPFLFYSTPPHLVYLLHDTRSLSQTLLALLSPFFCCCFCVFCHCVVCTYYHHLTKTDHLLKHRQNERNY